MKVLIMAYFFQVFLQIGNTDFSTVLNSFTTTETWEETSQTADLLLAQKRTEVSDQIQKGSKVILRASQTRRETESDFQNVFEGYVKEIQPTDNLLKIVLENEAYQLKRKQAITTSYGNATLKDLLSNHFPEIKNMDSVPDMVARNVVIRGKTPYQLLEDLKQKYLIEAYFRGRELHVGMPFLIETELPVVEYDLGQDLHHDNLKFREAGEVKLKAKATSIQKDGSKLSVEVGDTEGEQRSLFYRGIESEEALRALATADLNKLKVDGLSGSFTDFGLKFLSHSYKVRLKAGDTKKNGRFWVDKVRTEVSVKVGIERKIFLGRAV